MSGAISRIMNNKASGAKLGAAEKLYKEEASYRKDRLREKWARIPEIGNGFEKLEERSARDTAQNLENQARLMARLTETQMSNAYQGFSPENMLRLVRLAFPNTIRNKLK